MCMYIKSTHITLLYIFSIIKLHNYVFLVQLLLVDYPFALENRLARGKRSLHVLLLTFTGLLSLSLFHHQVIIGHAFLRLNIVFVWHISLIQYTDLNYIFLINVANFSPISIYLRQFSNTVDQW